MHDKINTLYDLCEVVSRKLGEANEKIRIDGGELCGGDVEYIDKLTHTLKSIKTVIAMMEAEDDGGYSGRYMPMHGYDMRRGNSYADGRDGRTGGNSYARGRGRSAKRDSRGRYSREGGYSYAEEMDGVIADIEELIDDLPEEKRRKVERLVDELKR